MTSAAGTPGLPTSVKVEPWQPPQQAQTRPQTFLERPTSVGTPPTRSSYTPRGTAPGRKDDDEWDPVKVHNAAQVAYSGYRGASTPPRPTPMPPQALAAGPLAAGLQPSLAAPVPGTLTPPQAPTYSTATGLDYKPLWPAANPALGYKEPEKVIGAINRR